MTRAMLLLCLAGCAGVTDPGYHWSLISADSALKLCTLADTAKHGAAKLNDSTYVACLRFGVH